MNDLRDDLKSDVVVDDDFRLSKITAINRPENNENIVQDISDEGEDVDISGDKFIKIYKLKTKIFDGVSKKTRLKDIDLLSLPPLHNFYDKISKLSYRKKSKGHMYMYKKIGFLLLGLIFIGFGFKYTIEITVNSGYDKIIKIKENSGNFELIQKNVNDSKFDFIIADILFKPFLFIPNHNIENVYHIIKGGKEVTKLGDNLVQFYSGLQSFIHSKGLSNIALTNLLYNQRVEFLEAENLLSQALYHYDQIGDLGNTELDNKVAGNILKLKKGLSYLNTINSNFPTFLNILGHEQRKKYLVVFQNNDEIRPTGGFMGSVGVVSVYRGKIVDFEKSDIYAYEWEINQFYEKNIETIQKMPAPKGLDQLTPTFGLRDANYFVNFDKSSKQIKFFLDTINKHVDGIVYINQNLVLDFLEETGGIFFDTIEKEVNRDNFSLLMSTLVEAKTFKVGGLGSPKQILFDFSEKFIKVLNSQKDYFAYLNIIIKNIKSRDIVFYSFNSEENSFLWKVGLNGELNFNNTFDFNYPVFTSLSGNKSDRYVERAYKKITDIHEDCSIDNTLIINSLHHFTKVDEIGLNALLDEFDIKNKDHIQYIQGRGDNYQFVRVLLPKDAIVDPQDGLVVNTYEDYKVGEFFIKTRRLETSKYALSYTLPNSECKDYTYTLYKQPGIPSFDIESQMNGNISKLYDLKTDFYIK